MTLIIEYIQNRFFVSVSDRLTTISKRPQNTKFNKTIYCMVGDAYVCISFTGIAFVNDMPTDDWLASLILREKYSDKAAIIRDSVPMLPWSLKELKNRIVVGLKQKLEANADLRREGLEIRFTGIESNHRYFIQSQMIMRKPEKSKAILFDKLNGWRAVRNCEATLSVSGGWDSEGADIIEDLKDLGFRSNHDIRSDKHVAGLLLETLRKFADRFPEIGEQAMIIRTWLPTSETFVSFEPLGDHPVEPIVSEKLGTGRAAYTPWVIGPFSAYAPQQFMGIPDMKMNFSKSPGDTHVVKVRGAPVDPSKPKMILIDRPPRRPS